MFTVRRVTEEVEAKLYSKITGARVGKIERKVYDDGNLKMKIRLRDMGSENDGPVEVHINGSLAAELALTRGRGSLDFKTTRGELPPAASAGQLVKVQSAGRIIATGEFVFD